ncbi:MAG: CBS domain-containing protein [Actinomycetota bacterium]|nr:CBS domain-containing protein [Actinomycetota bacterium]
MATVRDLMSAQLLAVKRSTSVAEAATVMGERRVGSALVMDGDRLEGIFTERDIVRALGQHFDAASHPVSEWMTVNPVTVGPSTDAGDALQTMLQGGFRHLPVVDGDRVLGMVSMRDLTAAAGEG